MHPIHGLLVIVLAACARESAPAAGGASLAEGAHWQVRQAGSTLTVAALAGYHVNADFPTELVPDAGVSATGDFAVTGDTTGVLTVHGKGHISGTFRFGVCSGEICEKVSPHIAFDI